MAYKSSDIDLFIYGIEDEVEANKKLEEVYDNICEAIPGKTLELMLQRETITSGTLMFFFAEIVF
jgi:hypothetical protein